MQDNAEKSDVIVRTLTGVTQGALLICFGLLPLICIPSTFLSIGYTKIIIAALVSCIAVILSVFVLLRTGVVRMRLEWTIVALWVAFAVALVSSLFSGDFFDSFWGTELSIHSGVFVGILALVTTIWSIVAIDKKKIIRLYLLLLLSAVVLGLFHIVRVVGGVDMFSVGGLFQTLSATPFGEWNSLAVFFGLSIVLSLLALEQLSLQLPGRILFSVVIGLSLLLLGIIGFSAVFVVLALVSLLTLVYGLTRGKFKLSEVVIPHSVAPAVSIFASLITFIISIIFVIGGTFIGSAVSHVTGISYIEVRPSLESTVGVAQKVYVDHAVLGTGPNRFGDAWRMHHDPSINATIFWNTYFQAGYGFIPTVFITHGIIGGLVWVFFLVLFLCAGVRTLWRIEHVDAQWYFISLSSFVAGVYLWIMAIVYVPNATILLLAAACTGIFLATRRQLFPETVHEYALLQKQQLALVTVGGAVVVVVLSVGSMYSLGRGYVASYLFAKGYAGLEPGTDTTTSFKLVERAYALTRDDSFAQKIALYKQKEVVHLVQTGDNTPDVQTAFQNTLASAVNWAKIATVNDSTEADHWDTLGRVYATVVPLNIENAYQLAHDSLEKARELDPLNPARLVTLGELELVQKKNTEAREYINRAIALKPNFTDAMYILTQIEIAEGNVDAAIEATRKMALLDSANPVRFFQLGVLQFSAKKYEAAAQSFTQAITLSPEYANARYFLALALSALGKPEDAKMHLTEVLRLNPESAEVSEMIQKLSQGGSIVPNAPGEQPLMEGSESARNGDTVTSGGVPDSKAIVPANVNVSTTTP